MTKPQCPSSASPEPEDVFDVQTDEQLHAIGSLARHRVLRVLRDGPATVTQIAEQLGIAKGSSHYHVKVLEKAGLIRIVETRKVRGVEERYYGMVAEAIRLPEPAPGQPDPVMRHALADLESAPANDQKAVRLKHARLSPAAFADFEVRLNALVDELTELSDPDEAAADLFVAFYRPLDTKQRGEGQRGEGQV